MQGVVHQRDVDGGEDGEQQHFGDGQERERAVQQQVGDAELAGAHQGHAEPETRRYTAPAQQGQEDQGAAQDPGEHREVVVHVPGEIDADQAERERPEDGNENQYDHTRLLDRLAGGNAGGPGPLEIVAAEVAGDIHHLTDEEEAGLIMHLHGFGR